MELKLGREVMNWIWQYSPRVHRSLMASGHLADSFPIIPRVPGHFLEIQYIRPRDIRSR
jgi:hypothetical protein